MAIGDLIRNRRKQLGMTQEELARAVHVTPQAVSQWENGRTVPDIFNLSAIATILGVGKAELVGELGTQRPSWVVRDSFYAVANMRRKLKQFASEEGLEQTDRAIDYASTVHAGQLRKPSVFSDVQVPYVFHPYVLACHAHALGIRDDTVLATALLHDVCEDCGIEPADLPFGEEVREAVALLTKPKEKDGFSLDAYYKGIAQNPVAAIVKALDRCNNVSTMMASFPIEKVVEYIDETETHVLPLLDAIKHAYLEYYDACFVIKYQIYSTIESVKAAVMRL